MMFSNTENVTKTIHTRMCHQSTSNIVFGFNYKWLPTMRQVDSVFKQHIKRQLCSVCMKLRDEIEN